MNSRSPQSNVLPSDSAGTGSIVDNLVAQYKMINADRKSVV